MDHLQEIVSKINSCLSDYVLILLLLGAGIYLTIKTRFVQIRCFREGWNRTLGGLSLHGGAGEKGLSSYQALTAAIAAQVGTGNIVGASGAILTGGPGAIFWMWIIAFFGMATIYVEAVLAQKTRIEDPDGSFQGGPVYYIRYAFPNLFGKIIAFLFAVAAVISLGFMGVMVQANSIGETCTKAFGIPGWGIGLMLVVFAAGIFLGGVSRLASVTEKIVPLMAVVYLFFGMIILILRYRYLPETFGCIFKYAFMPDALIGGGFGYALKTAVSQGVKRGLFSNEAGMGSTPHAHAAAHVKHPHDQGVVAMIGVFIDTGVVLTMTALIVISTIYTGNGPLANATGATYQTMLANAGLTKTNLMQLAVSSVSSELIGNLYIAVCLFFFAFSTILSWNYFGKINFSYLFGKKYVIIYSILSIIAIMIGTLVKNDLVWELQDMFNQLMVLPNAIALFALSGLAAACARKKE